MWPSDQAGGPFRDQGPSLTQGAWQGAGTKRGQPLPPGTPQLVDRHPGQWMRVGGSKITHDCIVRRHSAVLLPGNKPTTWPRLSQTDLDGSVQVGSLRDLRYPFVFLQHCAPGQEAMGVRAHSWEGLAFQLPKNVRSKSNDSVSTTAATGSPLSKITHGLHSNLKCCQLLLLGSPFSGSVITPFPTYHRCVHDRIVGDDRPLNEPQDRLPMFIGNYVG